MAGQKKKRNKPYAGGASEHWASREQARTPVVSTPAPVVNTAPPVAPPAVKRPPRKAVTKPPVVAPPIRKPRPPRAKKAPAKPLTPRQREFARNDAIKAPPMNSVEHKQMVVEGLKPVRRHGPMGTRGKIGLGLAAAGVFGGGMYALHRQSQNKKKEPAVKSLLNPFEEVIVFGKAYPVALPVSSSTRLKALVPTGANVGHGLDLGVYHGGGPAITRTQLQTYHGHGPGLHPGPFHGSVHQPKTKLLRVSGSGPGFKQGPFSKASLRLGKLNSEGITRGEQLGRKLLHPDLTTGAGQRARQVQRSLTLASPRRSIPNSKIPAGPSVGRHRG